MAQSNARPAVRPLSFTVMPFGQHQGKVFDQIPVGYLDWLSGQNWLYGELRKRLTLYLTRPSIQQLLDELFPEEWDDSRKPVFTVQGTFTNREPMPKADNEPWDWQPKKPSLMQAWETAADYLFKFETAEDPNDLLGFDFEELQAALKVLSPKVRLKLADAYRACRERLRTAKAEPTGNAYRFNYLVRVTKEGKLSKRGKQTAWLSEVA